LETDSPPAAPIPVLILFGPTASGKTNLLLELFASSDKPQAEIISADSMQVYRGMNIGTAKPSFDERNKLPHHLIDICDPPQQFNAGDFVRLADIACTEIAKRGILPVVSGGTGFYLKNFILGLNEAPSSDKEIREQLKNELNKKGILPLMKELSSCDPVSAGRIHINDEYRLLRALEVYRFCGRPLSSFEINTPQKRSNYRFVIIGLSCSREELYRRINLRCEEMFRSGLAEEVHALYKAGYTPDDPGLRAIGYREFFIKEVDENSGTRTKWRLSHDIDGVKALVAQNSRRYAKRQTTFFSGMPYVQWIEAINVAETIKHIKDILAESFSA